MWPETNWLRRYKGPRNLASRAARRNLVRNHFLFTMMTSNSWTLLHCCLHSFSFSFFFLSELRLRCGCISGTTLGFESAPVRVDVGLSSALLICDFRLKVGSINSAILQSVPLSKWPLLSNSWLDGSELATVDRRSNTLCCRALFGISSPSSYSRSQTASRVSGDVGDRAAWAWDEECEEPEDDLWECCLSYSADLSSEDWGDELAEPGNRRGSLSSSILVGELELVLDSLCTFSLSLSNDPLRCPLASLSGLLYFRCAKSSLWWSCSVLKDGSSCSRSGIWFLWTDSSYEGSLWCDWNRIKPTERVNSKLDVLNCLV